MNHHKLFTVFILGSLFIQSSIWCEPFTIAALAVAGLSTVGVGLWKGVCYVKECCTDRWTRHNHTRLKDSFKEELFGQHIVRDIVSNAVRNHIENDSSKKALVFSFHGWTGSGKNYVSDLIAMHVYREGLKSNYVHKKIATHHYPYRENISIYKDDLRDFVMKNTKLCGRSMFIIDEMDKMPPGLADVLKPFLDYHDNVEGIDFRKNIFVFLSNTAGDWINKATIKHFQSGKARELITSRDMEKILSVGSFNMEGGFKNSDLIVSNLVDFFVPFLPMERRHVKECAEAEIKRRKQVPYNAILENVANELQYFPKSDPVYSTTGCKLVAKKVEAFL